MDAAEGNTMCTTGVMRTSETEYLLFKNKDFGRTHFDDRIVLDAGVFGVEGITTWAGTDPDRDEFSGFSIGANAHGLLCCDSNVRTLPDHANYDDLVEIALRQGRDVEGGIDAVRRAVERQAYLWGNLLLIDGHSSAIVEVRGDVINVTRVAPPIARSNHHVELGTHPQDDDTVTTRRRLASAEARIGAVTSLEDVFSLQASHDDGSTGICNHALHQTVYSYVLRRDNEGTTLFVLQGRPCENSLRTELDVPLGASWSPDAADDFRAAYPSSRARVSG